MQKLIPYLAILIVIVYAVYNAKFRKPKKVDTHTSTQEGGFAAHDDAEKIACYVLDFSGKKCTTPTLKMLLCFTPVSVEDVMEMTAKV